MTISGCLLMFGVPTLLLSLGYIFISQWKIVRKMGRKVDELEAGKIRLSDLTDDEFTFILARYNLKFLIK